jgi:hypothetical protein
MAVITEYYYGVTVGDASLLTIQAFSTYQADLGLGTCAVTWNEGSGPYGGYFQLTGTYTPAPGDTIQIIAYATQAISGLVAPLSSICRNNNWIQNVFVNAKSATQETTVNFVAQMAAARIACIESVCDATATGSSIHSYTFSGKSQPFLQVGFAFLTAENDAGVELFAVADQAQYIAPTMNATPAYIPSWAAIVSMVGTTSGQGNQQLPLDIDVAINNGANIFSVCSRTFTEPGSGS